MVLHLRWFCISNSPRTAVTFGVGNVRLSWSDVIRFIWSLYIWLLVAKYLHVFCQDCIQRFCPGAFRRPVFSLARPGKLFACKWHRENCLHANFISIKFKTDTRSEQLTLWLNTVVLSDLQLKRKINNEISFFFRAVCSLKLMCHFICLSKQWKTCFKTSKQTKKNQFYLFLQVVKNCIHYFVLLLCFVIYLELW